MTSSGNRIKEGILTIDLDPKNGYMPVRIFQQKMYTIFEDDRSWWDEELTTVQDSKQNNEVWMPTVLQLRETASVLRGQINIFTTTLDQIERSSVAPADVTLAFPEGCEITDAIHGNAYTI